MTYFVIYENPLDFPGKFVLRQHSDHYESGVALWGAAAEPDAVEDTLEAVRHKLPAGVFNMGRYSQDDPVIKEVWI